MPAMQIAPLQLNFYELTLVISGTITYFSDSEDITINSGDAIFLRPGIIRKRKQTDENVDYVSFNFISASNTEILSSLPNHILNCITGEIKLLLDACDRINIKALNGCDERILHILCTILLQLIDNQNEEKTDPVCLKIKKYLRSNLDRRITLDDISKLTFFSPYYCDALFRKETGGTIIDYLIDERISEAKHLILDNSIPLTQIAVSVGFNDYNYFARVFKKRTGYTPTQYRKNYPISLPYNK